MDKISELVYFMRLKTRSPDR